MQQQTVQLQSLARIEQRVTMWLTEHSMTLLRGSLGLVFLAFGLPKFFPGGSPAEAIATRVTSDLTFGMMPDDIGIILVALMETAIGLSLVSGRFMKAGLALLGMALVGILAPLFLFPQDLLSSGSLAPTLEGQYVFKDIVLAAAALVVALRERGAELIFQQVDRRSDA